MTQKKNNSSKLARSLKKGARSLLSGKKDLAKLAAALPLTAVLVEEVRAAQAKTNKPADDLLRQIPLAEENQLDQDQQNLVQDSKASLEAQDQTKFVQDEAASARDSLRAVLEDEINSAQATASANTIDPNSPKAGQQAVRSVLNDEVSYEVAKAIEASPQAAEVLANLPGVDIPQAFSNSLSGFSLGQTASAVAVAALTGGAGGGVIGAASTLAGGGSPVVAALKFSGAAIDGYVQGATVNYQVKVDGVWTTVATTLTDAEGTYKFDGLKAEWASGRVVIEAGGYDANTGQQVGAFISNASASETDQPIQTATPLTMVLALSGLGEDEFKAQLGITEVADLGTFDPVDAMKFGNAALGEKVFAIQQGVYTLLQAASAVAGGGTATATSLNDAVAAVGKAIADNYNADLGVMSVSDITAAAISQVAVGGYATAVTSAINLVNASINTYYTGLADAFRVEPPTVESQSAIAAAKAAAAVSQSSLLAALVDGSTGALTAFEGNFPAELAIQVAAFKEIAALEASEVDLNSTIANPVFLVHQALEYKGGMPTYTEVKDLAGEFTQISLAKLIDLNVKHVTLLGTNDRVELQMQGNGSTNTDAEIQANLVKGLFEQSYTVTLRVTDGDVAQIIKQLPNVDFKAIGIDMIKPVAGTLKISKADALDLIEEGLSFSTGSFQLKPGDSLSFAEVQKLVIEGGLKLADNTSVNLSGADVQLDTDTAFELLAAGAKFTGANDLSLLLEARHLNGNAQAVVDKLLSLVGVGTATTGLGFVFDASSKSPASGVTFTAGKLALSGLTLTEAQAAALVNADISQSVKFNNTAITFKTTDYVGKVDSFVTELKALFKSGITKFTVSGDVSKDVATQLLNIDSSVQLYATVTEPLTASIAMGFAARGVTPTNVNFDIDYVKSYILVDGNKLTSTITVNVPFSDDTITPTDFVNLIAAGVRFQAGIGSVLIKETDAAFTMGSDAVANQLKLVNAGLKLASGSASLTDATLTLANAQKLQAAHVNAADPVFGDITLQLSSADLASADLKANLAKLNFADLTVRPISGALTAAQVDALQTIKPSTTVHFEFASLQLDANAIALAAQKAAGYYSGLGISNAVISVTSMSYAQAKALSLAGITKVNAGVVLTLDNIATTDNFAQLDSLQAMGFAKLSVPATTAITKAQFDAIVAEYPKFTFEPGSKIDLSDASNPGLVGTTLAKAAIYSAAGLTLVNMDTLAAKDISLSQAVSLASKGAKFTSEVNGENLVIYKDANTATKTYQPDLTMSQVKALFASVSSGTEVSFSGFTSLRLSSTDLGNLDAAMAAKLAKTGLPGISLIDAPSVNQVLKLAGTSLQLVGSVTLSDKSVSNVADALTVIAKGAVFSGATLVLPAEGGLQSLIGNGLDLDGKSIGVLKAKGFTTIDLSNGQISQADATTIMNWGGLKFANANLVTGTAPIDVSVVSSFAALGISVPSTAVISSSSNSVTFDQAMAIASKGGAIALASGSVAGTHVTVNAAGKAALSFAEADIVLSKVQNVAFAGVNTIQLAAKNADFAAVTALAGKLQDAGITSIKLATGASLSVNIAQLQTLSTEGVSFATGSDVRLQLSSGSLSEQFAAIGALGSSTAGVGFIKAAGASLTLTRADFINLPSTMKFVATDMVTVKVSTLNPGHLDAYKTAGVDFVGAEGGKITISATAAQAVVTANTVKLLPTDVVTVSLDSTAMVSLPSQIAGYKAIGVDNFVVDAGVSVSYASVQAVLTNQLSFTNNVTVNIAAGNADELNYVIDNSGSLASAGVKEVNVDGNLVALSMKQLSSLLAAGTGGIKFVDNIKVTVNTAADLAYFAASAKDIQVLQNVKELSLDPSIINIPLATAQLLAKSYQLTPPATVVLDFASATQLSQNDFIALKAAGFVTFNFGGVSVDPSAQLDGLVAKLVGAGYVQGQLPVEVTGIMVNTTFANNATDNTLKDFGFKDNTGFINKPSLNLVDKAAGNGSDGNLVFEGGVFKVFEKGGWTEAKTIISPTGAAVKIVATNSDNAITAAEFKALSSLTGGKVSFTGVNLQLKDAAEAAALTAKVVSTYKALGITSVDAGSFSGWDVKTVSAVQSAGLKFANVKATITDSSITLNDYQAMKGLGFTISDSTLLRDKVVVGGVTNESIPSLTAAVAQQLLKADDIKLAGVIIKDGSLSATTALSLSEAGLNVSSVLVSGNVSVDDALALLNPSSTNSAPIFAVKGFFSGNTLTTTATKQTIDIDQALKLTKVLGLGDVRIKVEANGTQTPDLLPKLATLLAQDPTAKFSAGSYLTCDSLTLSEAKQLFSLGGGLVSTGTSGVELKLTLDSSNSNFSEILGVAKALKVKVIDCDSKPLTLSTAQHADYIASKITLDKVSGSIQLTVASAEDITYVVNNALALKDKVALVTTGTSLTLTNEQFTTYQAAGTNGVKFADKVSISVSLTQDQLDASNLASTLATLKAANVAGVVCLADKGLSNAAVAELIKAGVTVLGSPTLKVQPDPEKVGELFSAGFNVQVTPDLTNVSLSKALTLAAIDGVKTVSLVSGASDLTVSQSDWLNPSARALIDKVLLSTGSKPAMNITGVEAGKVEALLAEQGVNGVTIKQLALQAGQSIITSTSQWDGRWTELTTGTNPKVIGLAEANITIAGVSTQAEVLRLASQSLVDKVYLSSSSGFKLDATNLSAADVASLAKVYYAGGSVSLINSLAITDNNTVSEDTNIALTSLFTNDLDVGSSTLSKSVASIKYGAIPATVDVAGTTVSTPYGDLFIKADGNYSFTTGGLANALPSTAHQDLVFAYTVQNGTTVETNSLTIRVNGVNDAPVATFTAAQAVLEDTIISGQLTSTDIDTTHSATYTLIGQPITGLTINANGSWTFDASSYDSLSKDAELPITVNYLVTDDKGATNANSFVITVTGSNDAPVATFTAAQAALEDTTISGQLTSTDIDTAHSATYTLVGEAITGLTINSNGSWTFDASSYDSLSKDVELPITVNYLVTDDKGATNANSFVITVKGTNDAPVATFTEAQAVLEDATISGQLTSTDVDTAHSATYTLIGQPITGLTINANGAWTFDASSYDSLPKDAELPITVNYLVTDDKGATNANSFVITVTGTNDAPQLSVSSQSQNVTEDQTVGVPSLDLLTGVATDVDSSTLSIQGPTVTAYMVDSTGIHTSTVATFPSGLPLTPTTGAALWLDGSQLKINPAAQAFQFLNNGEKLEVSISYKIADTTGGESTTATASFTVAGKSEGSSFSAKVIDGYVQGARVFYDTDGDGKYDAGEAFAITDANGNYNLFVDNDKLVAGGKGNLIAELDWKDGDVEHFATDKFTGKILTGDLIAPEGFNYITPLTTLVALTVEKGQDPVVLAKSIADGLGLTASLQNYDPFASMTSTNPAVAAQAELVFKAQQMVFTVMQAATTALVEASPGVTNPLLTMAKAVTSAITSGTPKTDLSDTLSEVSTKAINNLFKGDEVAVAKAGAIIQSINTVNAQIDDNYSGLSTALINKDPVAIAKAEAAAGVSQDLLIEAVKSVASAKTVSAIADATLSQADVTQAVTDAVVSDPDMANATSIHKQDSGNLLQASLKSLAGKTAIVMDGVAANPVTNDFDVSLNYAAAGDTSGVPSAALPGITAKDAGHKAISAGDLNVTLNVTGQSQVNELAGTFAAPSANLGSLGIDHVNLSFADGDVANLLNASSTLNLSINALAQEGVDVSGTIDRSSKDALHLNDTQSTDLVLDGLHFAADDTIVLDVNASGTNLNTSLKQLQKLGVDAVSVAGGVDGINIDLGSDFNFSSMGGLPKFGDANANGTLTTDEQADLHVTLNATSSQVDGVADNATTFVSAGIDQVAFDLTSEGQLQSLLNNDVALNQLVDSRLDAVVDFGSADVNVQSLGINGDNVTLEVEAAQGTHLSTSLKDLQKLGVDAVSVAGGVDGINVDLGAGFKFDAATGSVTLFGDANADGILSAQEDGALHVTLNATSNNLANLGTDAADFALAGVDEIFFDVGNEAGLTSLLGNDTALAALDNAKIDVTVDVGGVHVDVDALHLDGDKITLDAEGASQGTHLSTSLKDLQKLGVDAVSVAGGVTELNLDLGSGSDAFTFSGTSVVNFQGDANLRVTLSTTEAGQIDDLATAAGSLHTAGIDAVNLDLSGQGGLNALLGTGNLTDDLRALDAQLDKLQAAHVEAIVGISQDQAQEILKDASTFSFNADDTIVMHTDTAAQGTHLSTSLKELQKLGVDAVSVAAGVTGINVDLGAGFDADLAGGVALFGDTNSDGILSAQEDAALHVTLNASSSDLLNLSGDAADFALAGVDEIFFNAGNETGLKTLLGDQAKLDQLNAANLDVTVDFGGVHVDVDALHLGKDGNITLNAEGASHGTHLNTSLKDLQKLGVDAVSVAGGVGEISLNLGDGALTLSSGALANIQGDADLRVTLNSTDVAQLDDIMTAANGLQSAGIDAVNLDLSGQGSLDTLLGAGDLASEIGALNTQLDALDHTGLQAIVGISQDQAQELIAEAANFTFDTDITAVLHADTAAQGTHLNTSLKELQKLGVDAVSVAAGVTGINIDLGGGNDSFTLADGSVAFFGDANADGILSAQEDAALHVTLNTTDADLSNLSADGNLFANAGIDEVTFQLDAAGLESLLGQSEELAALHVPNLDVTVDFGGVHVGVDALSIDDNDQITLDAAGASQGTHLSTSLKDLQKLGVDAVSVASGVHDINLNLGSGTEGFDFAGGSDIRIKGDEDLNVTLNVADTTQLHDVALLDVHQVSNIGIDAVKLDLSGQGNLDTLLGAGTLKRDLGALEVDLGELRTDGLQAILGIDQAQAGELLAHGLAFNVDDTIVLNASVDASQGTHLSTSLKDLQKLGVDAVSVAAGTNAINVDLGTGFGQVGEGGFSLASGGVLFGDTNADGSLTAQEADALHVTLNATGADLTPLVAGDNESQFALAGIDEVSFKLDADGLETLLDQSNAAALAELNSANLNVTVDFGSAHVNVNDLSLTADGDVVMAAQGTHLNTSLKDLQKLGVDAVSVAAGINEINLDLGSDNGFQIQAASLPTFDSQNIDVTLNVANAGQVDELASFVANDGSLFGAGIDAVKLDLAGEGSLDALLGRGQLGADFAAFEADLTALRNDGLGNLALDTIVGIDQAQAQQLLAGGLDFNAADTVFLNASEGAQGTHLSTSLKDLQKLGVDAVSVAAGATAINLDLGASADDAFSLSGGSVLFGDANEDGQLSLNEDNGLHVTLNALSGDLSSLSTSAQALNATGIDEISFSLSSEGELESLLGSGNLTALNNIALNHIDVTVDFGSSHINVQDLSYDSKSDSITYDLSEASQGTHLSTSLKDLQKLGVDAVSIGANVHDVSLDLGSAFSLSSAQNQDGSLPVFGGGTDLHVTLNVADTQQLDFVGSLNATDLLSSGIDAVKLDLAGEGSLDTLLGRGLLASDLSALETSLAAVRDGTALDTVIGIDQGQAHELLSEGLNFAFAGQDTALLNASAGAQGTHLSTSLKDLQKLGIDAVTVAAGFGPEISLDFGFTGAIDASKGFAIFGDTNADGKLSLAEDNALKVTLDVADLAQMGNVSALNANVLSTAGVDAVRLDLVGDGSFSLASLETQLLAVRNDGLESIVGIDLSQAATFINQSVHFAIADTVTLDASAGGTHLSTSLKDLQKLGVDAVSFDADVNSIQVNLGNNSDLLSATGIPEFNSALDVTLNIHGQYAQIGAMSETLAEAGIDHLGVFSTDLGEGGLETLFNALDSGLDVTLNVGGTANQNLANTINFVDGGLDLLSGKGLSLTATWGDLIQTLHDSGLGNVQIQESANVTINDDLSAALYESGMLHALPEANITIQANTALLNTSLKAMADLGVDSVASSQSKVYVELGIKPEDIHTIAGMHDLFSAFGLDTTDGHSLFAANQHAGLVIDQTTFNSLGAHGVQQLVGQLSQLGFTELDVVGADKVDAMYGYKIDVTAQTPVLSEVKLLGTDEHATLAHVFDPDILHKAK